MSINDTGDLQAYSPTGAEIVDTVECGLGTHKILHFYKDGNKFVHEFGDDYHDGDPDTLAVDGSTIYQDANGKHWAEAALTFKNDDDEIVHQGQDLPPVDLPGFEQAMTLAVKANLLAGDKKGMTEQDWESTANKQEWEASSQVIHLEGFIREMGLMSAFAAYAARAAEEENAGAEAL